MERMLRQIRTILRSDHFVMPMFLWASKFNQKTEFVGSLSELRENAIKMLFAYLALASLGVKKSPKNLGRFLSVLLSVCADIRSGQKLYCFAKAVRSCFNLGY